MNCFLFSCANFVLLNLDPDPDTDPGIPLNPDPLRIQIGTDPDLQMVQCALYCTENCRYYVAAVAAVAAALNSTIGIMQSSAGKPAH